MQSLEDVLEQFGMLKAAWPIADIRPSSTKVAVRLICNIRSRPANVGRSGFVANGLSAITLRLRGSRSAHCQQECQGRWT